MKLGTLILLLALVTAPACGGGSSDSGIGSSPGPLAAGFMPDKPTPGAKNAAMLQGTKSNDVVNVAVTLTDVNGVFGTAFEVVFDDSRATYLGYSGGTAIEGNGNVPNYTVDGASNPGRIVVGVARVGGTTTDISGTKTVVNLQFRVEQTGTTPVTLQNTVVYDGQPTPQPIAGILWFAGALTGA